MVTLIEGISALSYSSRRYFSTSVRRALIRYIHINTPDPLEIPDQQNVDSIASFLARISQQETNTGGVIEQRVTDFLSSLIYPSTTWRRRGFGDPVNATNTSSKKLGDTDFQNSDDLECHAIEAHAGRLTPVYVHEHLRTLRRNISEHTKEWSSIADTSDWSLKLIFVVHVNACQSVPEIGNIGFTTHVEIKSYQDLISEAMTNASPEDVIAEFNKNVISVLNASNTPHATKEKAIELLG